MMMIRPGSSHDPTPTPFHEVFAGNGPVDSGPVFLPRRRPSAYARQLLDEARDATAGNVTPYDDLWFAGRPVV